MSQSSRFRLQFIYAEQFDNVVVGTPWLTDLVSTQVDMDTKRAILRSIIVGTYGVHQVDSLNIAVLDSHLAVLDWNGVTKDNQFFLGEIDNAQ